MNPLEQRQRGFVMCIGAILLLLSCASLIVGSSHALPRSIKLGGLFDPSHELEQELAFTHAISSINADSDLLPHSRLSAQIEQVTRNDSFHAIKSGQSKCQSCF